MRNVQSPDRDTLCPFVLQLIAFREQGEQRKIKAVYRRDRLDSVISCNRQHSFYGHRRWGKGGSKFGNFGKVNLLGWVHFPFGVHGNKEIFFLNFIHFCYPPSRPHIGTLPTDGWIFIKDNSFPLKAIGISRQACWSAHSVISRKRQHSFYSMELLLFMSGNKTCSLLCSLPHYQELYSLHVVHKARHISMQYKTRHINVFHLKHKIVHGYMDVKSLAPFHNELC